MHSQPEAINVKSYEKKSDRIIVSGLKSDFELPGNVEERSQWFSELVEDFLSKFDPDVTGKISFINQLGRFGDRISAVEVRMTSVEAAKLIRKAFVNRKKKKEANSPCARGTISNSVTLATRVRSEILWAMAKQYGTKDEKMYVSTFDSRPRFHVKATGSGKLYSLTFADSLLKYGKNLKIELPRDAYEKVGTAFSGTLEHYFVVLNDRTRKTIPVTRGQGGVRGAEVLQEEGDLDELVMVKMGLLEVELEG